MRKSDRDFLRSVAIGVVTLLVVQALTSAPSSPAEKKQAPKQLR
jgi:hypothetical protein